MSQTARMQYWLMKTEPDVYSIDDLAVDGQAEWEGVRNYQARNFMRDTMKLNDRVLFYHSNSKPSGVVGLARVAKEGYPDFHAWDPKSKYFDEKSTPDAPRWFMVDLKFERKFKRIVGLPELREVPELADMPLLNRSRLSVQPCSKAEFELICQLAKTKGPA